MQFPKTLSSVILALLFFSWTVWAQEKADRELEIHKNIKLVELSSAPDLPEDLRNNITLSCRCWKMR